LKKNQCKLLSTAEFKTKSKLDSIIDLDLLTKNDFGHIRRSFVKRAFNDGSIDYDDVLSIYDEWRNDDEYICLQKLATYKQKDLLDNVQEMIDDVVYSFIKASKRGNDVYSYLVKQKFKPFENIKDVSYFIDEFSRKKTKLLFITLTFDAKEMDPIESWYLIPHLWNTFKANLTKKYGRIKTFRTWESTEKYYAHIHALIYFEETEFECFEHINKDGRKTYRIPYYQAKQMKKYYPYHIDVQACDTFKNAMKEVTKCLKNYILKDTKSDKPKKTNAMIWLTGKQGYSCSKDFFESIIGSNIDVKEPTSADLISIMCNSNQLKEKWAYVGIVPRNLLRITGDQWYIEMKKPPPDLCNFIIGLMQDKLR
jgi:hypothetical protein